MKFRACTITSLSIIFRSNHKWLLLREKSLIFWRHNAQKSRSQSCIANAFFLFLLFKLHLLCCWIFGIRPTLNTTIKILHVELKSKHLINVILYYCYRQYLHPLKLIFHSSWCWDFIKMLLWHPHLKLKHHFFNSIVC